MKEYHFCPVSLVTDSYCLCGSSDEKAYVSTDLGRVTCKECIQVAASICVSMANLYAFYKTGGLPTTWPMIEMDKKRSKEGF